MPPQETAASLPDSIRPYAEKAVPVVAAVAGMWATILPYLSQAFDIGYKAYLYIEPYEGLQQLLFGFVLTFLGGTFITTIAAWEAFKMCGYDKTKKAIGTLYQSYLVAKAASDKDDAVDDDGDGVADVQQIDAKALVQRNGMLLLKVLDPDEVSDAIAGVWGGFMGVVAVLRIQFAQAVTLGAALGDTLTEMADTTVKPQVEALVDEEHKKWVAPALRYAIKSFAVTVAFFIQRVMSSFHSATRGAQMMVKGLNKQARIQGWELPAILDESKGDTQKLCTALAIGGFVWQLWSGFSVMFPLNILLLPFFAVEHFLMLFITY